MGDFERTFGAGADAVSIVEGYAREREKDLPRRGDKTRARSKARSLDGADIFEDLGSGLELIKTSIEVYYDEAIEPEDRVRQAFPYPEHSTDLPGFPGLFTA